MSAYLDGPLELVQGGKALIARFPIFLDYPINKEYWGSVSTVFHYSKILEKSGIKDLTNIDITLSRQLPEHASSHVFYGKEETLEKADFTFPIHLPNSSWLLAARYRIIDNIEIKKSHQFTWLLALLGAFILFISVAILYRAYHVARDISLKDELTKLPNRRFFMSYLQHRVQNTKRHGKFTLLNIDLNKFKAVNDSFGHDAGDALLIHVAGVLNKTLRSSDFTGRIGGDEFLVILDRCYKAEQVENIILKLETQFNSQPLYWKNQQIFASLSTGYAICQQDTLSAETLLSEADRSMYIAKNA